MPVLCWKCHERVVGAICVGCGAIQPPPPNPDFCEVLGLPRRFHLEDSEIEEAWRARSRLLHPDRHVSAGALQRRLALQWTALLNEARKNLRDPVRRATWLATGRPDPPEWGGPVLEPEFLEAIFEWRLAIEDPTVQARVRIAWHELQTRLDAVFSAWETGRGDLAAVPEILARVRAMKNLVVLL